MEKPNRSDSKYWNNPHDFLGILFDNDRDDYIIYLESELDKYKKYYEADKLLIKNQKDES